MYLSNHKAGVRFARAGEQVVSNLERQMQEFLFLPVVPNDWLVIVLAGTKENNHKERALTNFYYSFCFLPLVLVDK
jgi:predicted transcriptional regulator